MRPLRRAYHSSVLQVARLPGIATVLDASRITGVADTDPVGTWGDLSRNGVSATASLTRRPAYALSGINGVPALDFNGSSNGMDINGLATTMTGSDVPHTIVAVIQKDTNGADQSLLCGSNSGDANPLAWTFTNSTPAIVYRRRDDAATNVNPIDGSPGTSPIVVTVLFFGTTVTIRTNGVTSSVNNTACNVGTMTIDQVGLGFVQSRAAGAAIAFFDGKIGALVVSSGTPSSRDYPRIERYLARRFAMAL